MTTTHSSRLGRASALARRLRLTMIALALGAIGLGAGASASQAAGAEGSVYFDADNNAAAGETFFNAVVAIADGDRRRC